MESSVTAKNMVSIPVAIARRYGITPGWKLDWEPGFGTDEIIVRVIPDRAERARRLLGQGSLYQPETDSLDGLVAERESES
jgi:bifunctional DNA-binding transcriptional regulator/antitoxin component of YhaV-PrlF toxin-antitoxin module